MEQAQAVRVLKALADKRRFRMVQTIAAAGELSCGELGAYFDLAQPTVSHHLKIVRCAFADPCRLRRCLDGPALLQDSLHQQPSTCSAGSGTRMDVHPVFPSRLGAALDKLQSATRKAG